MHVMLNGDTYTSLQASKALGAVGRLQSDH